jgi:hypothetical protein
MKILSAILLLCSLNSFAQDSVSYKVEGYCGKTKLRDIQAVYGEAAFTNKAVVLTGTMIKEFVFDYGQEYKKDKEAMVCNAAGEGLRFTSIAHVLNFFDYNGWEYLKLEPLNNSYIILFRKKK